MLFLPLILVKRIKEIRKGCIFNFRALRYLQAGFIGRTIINFGTHQDFVGSSATVDLAFLGDVENARAGQLDPEVALYLDKVIK